jgi:hypothetical protein
LLEYENTLNVVTLQFLSNIMSRDKDRAIIPIPFQRQGPEWQAQYQRREQLLNQA